MLVGASRNSQMASDAGAAYVWVHDGASWTQEAKLMASDARQWEFFGVSCALVGDDAVIGAMRGHTGLDYDFVGTAYTFERAGTVWTQTAKLMPGVGTASEDFGQSVDLSAGRIVVGAPAFLAGGLPGRALSFDLPPVILYTPFCFGDGSGPVCPCGNPSAPGAGEGCANSTGLGGLLYARGTQRVSEDDLVMDVFHLPAKHTALVAAGPQATGAGVPFGDGLWCLAIQRRLTTAWTDLQGYARFGPGLGDKALWAPGESWYFQVVYRTAQPSPCGQVLNATNAVAVAFTP